MKKRMRMVLALTTVTMLALGCVGCESNEQAEEAPEVPVESTEGEAAEGDTLALEDLQVALVLPGSVNDKGWNQEAYEGLLLIKELGCETAYSESVAATDYETVYRGYADLGYDIIIGHGVEFEDTAIAVASDYEDTTFWVTSSKLYQEPNVGSIQNLNNEQGFIAGMVAALATESNIVGSVGGMEVPSIQSYMLGFEQGVAYVDENVKVLISYTGDFDDASKVKEQVNAYVSQGADIISHHADGAGLGLYEAIKETEDGVYAIGSVTDQNAECPKKVLTSATNSMSAAIGTAVQKYVAGEFGAESYEFGIAEGVIGLADWHDCADVLSDEDKAFVEETLKKIANDEIEIENYQG